MTENRSLEELVEQFLEQCRSGNAPEVSAFAAAHPGHASELLNLLPLVLEMEGLNAEITRRLPHQTSEVPELPDSDYRLIRRLGSGGTGVVFEALQLSLNRKVAVKLLSPLLLKDTARRGQFENEARVIAMLHHPNIVKVFGAGCSAERCY